MHVGSSPKNLARQKVVVCDYPDGRLEIKQEGIVLPYRTFDTLRSVNRSEIVGNKRLDAVLSMVADMQAGRKFKRSQRAPRKFRRVNASSALYERCPKVACGLTVFGKELGKADLPFK